MADDSNRNLTQNEYRVRILETYYDKNHWVNMFTHREDITWASVIVRSYNYVITYINIFVVLQDIAYQKISYWVQNEGNE